MGYGTLLRKVEKEIQLLQQTSTKKRGSGWRSCYYVGVTLINGKKVTKSVSSRVKKRAGK